MAAPVGQRGKLAFSVDPSASRSILPGVLRKVLDLGEPEFLPW
jgi:hypothetical protein